MTMTRSYCGALLAFLVLGCEQGDVGGADESAQSVRQVAPADENGKSYESIPADVPGCFERAPLCEVLRRPSVTYGLYRVISLKGFSEKTPAGVPKGVTYVALERLGGPGPDAPVAKIRGGPRPDGTYAPGPVSLTVGEVIAAVLHKDPASEWYTFSTPDVFRQLQPAVFGNVHEKFPGSATDFLKRLEHEARTGCGPTRLPPASPEGLPPVITDYVDDEVMGEQRN